MSILINSFSKDKGSWGNKMDCAGSQVGNAVVARAKIGGVAAGLFATATLAKKNPKTISSAINSIAKMVKSFAKTSVGQKMVSGLNKLGGGKIKDVIKAAGKYAKANPVTTAIVAASAVAASIATNIYGKHAFKAGQIDQKYADRAKAQGLAK